MNLALKDSQKNSLSALETLFSAARGATTQAAIKAAFAHARGDALRSNRDSRLLPRR